ncbi:MAG: serine hydrolase domain-containing protein [Anaeromyxobacteraceae bacterium]
MNLGRALPLVTALAGVLSAGCGTTAAVRPPPAPGPAEVPVAAATVPGPAAGPLERVRVIVEDTLAAEKLPSLSVAVARPGAETIAYAAGFSDLEHRVPATVDTVYRVGSVSKPLTAVTALALAEHGVLDLDAPVQRYCPAFPAGREGVTVRRLLGHLGGVRDYDAGRGEFVSRRHFESFPELVGYFSSDPPVAAPGARYQYSVYGYDLVGCALEGAGQARYAELVRQHVLEPAGMISTLLDEPEAIVPHRARGYELGRGGRLWNAALVDLSNRWPAGGWLSTPSDLVAFGRALLGGLVSPGSRAALWTPQHLADGASTGYGLGFGLPASPPAAEHAGSSVGASAFLWIDPADGTVVAFTTNLQFWNDAERRSLVKRLAAAVR